MGKRITHYPLPITLLFGIVFALITHRLKDAESWVSADFGFRTQDFGLWTTDHWSSAMLIFDDVDDARTTEERLIRLKKLVSIGRLSANLVHELGSPLDGVLRYTKLLLNQISEDDPRRTYIQQILNGLIRITNMVRGMSDFTRKSNLVSSPIEIPLSIRRILASFSDQITAQNIKVNAEFDENIPVILNVDVEHIFTHIIKNAIQAMPNGGVLSVNVRMLLPQLFEARFSDTGPGVPDEIRDSIFEPFFTTKDFGQSVGLGLSISREIAKSYNGSIDVESELGNATTFVVRLPVSESGLTEMGNGLGA